MFEPLSATFARFIVDVFEEEGAAWVESLPLIIREFEMRWSFTAEPPFPDLSYNYVSPVKTAQGTEAVLKLGVPRPEIKAEIAALRHYNGRGCVRLIAAAPEQGAMLLERLRPGQMLSVLNETDYEAATAVAAGLMQQLWRPLPEQHNFPTIADWGRGMARMRTHFDGGTGPFPKKLVEEAEANYRDLSASMDDPVLLHGDFHHWNIMTAQRQPWLAIDPKGVIGEPAYEIAPFLLNPLGWLQKQPDPARITARRIDIFADHLSLDRTRIIRWAIYQSVLSAWWSLEDQGYGWQDAIEIAEILQTLSRRK